MTALLISSAALVLIVLLYLKRPVQLVLRVVTIALLFLLITNVTIRMETEVPQNIPIVIVDYSMSMKTHHADILSRASDIGFPHELFFSCDSLLTTEQPQDLGTYTDLKGAIEQANRREPAFIILITDGNHNYGSSPLSSVGEFNTPVYTYGIGEEKPRDVAIIDVAYPKYAYRGDSVKIDAIVETGGFQTGMADLMLHSAKGEKIAAQSLPLSDIPARNTIAFTYLAPEPGTVQLRLHVPPQSNEMSYDDNVYVFSLNILEDKTKVLYYTDHISFNTKFILRSIQEDADLSLLPIARLSSNKYQDIEHSIALTSLPDLVDFDILIFDNVNLEELPWRNIPDRVSSGTGIVLSGTLRGISTAWLEVMPISVAEGTLHDTYQLEITEPFSVLVENKNPPVKNINRVVTAKEDAVIIARAGNLPLIGYRTQGRGKVFQLCVVDLGPWHFLRSGLKGDAFLYNLLGDMIRFVSPTGEYQRLLLNAKDRDYALGETVHLALQSYDRNFRPLGGGDFFLVIDDNKIPFYETRMGQYEASFVAEKKGQQQISTQGKLHGEKLSSNLLNINVSSRSAESEHRLNRELLHRLSAATGGVFHLLEELETIAVPETATKKESRILSLDSPITYFVVLISLMIDWIIRRRRGIT
ncbi:MAG: hypothetical protein WBE28_03095 [bacterium]